MSRVYLDYNATSPVHPEVLAAMLSIYREGPLNGSSLHQEGQRAKQLWHNLGRRLAELVDFPQARPIFTSGGTEANNLAIWGISALRPGKIIVTGLEHPSILGAAEACHQAGRHVVRLAANSSGTLCLDELEAELLGPEPVAMVSVMWANNETGVVQPVGRVAELCRQQGVPLHCDAVQAAGKVDLQLFDSAGLPLACQALTVSAHKIEGPPGIGALLLDPNLKVQPQLFGGHQQYGFRPGTEPVALAAGLVAALELWRAHRPEWLEKLGDLQRHFEAGLAERIPETVVIGRESVRLPTTSLVSFPGEDRQGLVMALDLMGIACSTGSACSSGSSERSHVLLAMGLPREWIDGAIRLSFGVPSTPTEIGEAIGAICRLFRSLRSGK